MLEREKNPRITKQKLVSTAIVFGNLSLALSAITSACQGNEEGRTSDVFSIPTRAARTIEPTSTVKPTAVITEVPTSTPKPEDTATPEPEPGPAGVFTTDNLNVREDPGLNFAVLDTMPKNTLGKALEGPTQSDGYSWWRVIYEDGTEGWSAQDWLKFGTWPATQNCNLIKPPNLRETTEYGIFGTDTFDTIVCGYLKLEEEEIFGEKTTTSYLAIIEASDDGFIQAVDSGIQIGNSVNRKGAYYFEFNLGCFKDGKIVGADYEGEEPYMDAASQSAILNSSPENPVSLKLSFGPHLGRGCICCNLAHQVRINS